MFFFFKYFVSFKKQLRGRGECVRLKNEVVNAQIVNNVIQDCGVHDYVFARGEKNGEGVYIGTSSKMVGDSLAINTNTAACCSSKQQLLV